MIKKGGKISEWALEIFFLKEGGAYQVPEGGCTKFTGP